MTNRCENETVTHKLEAMPLTIRFAQIKTTETEQQRCDDDDDAAAKKATATTTTMYER